MNNLGISTDPALLDVELPHTIIESPSVSTFLPEEEASICPLLSNSNSTNTPLAFSHPLTPCIDNDSNNSANLCNEDGKVDTTSSSGSSSGIDMDVPETGGTTLFSKHAYQHLQHNNGTIQDIKAHGPNNNITLTKDTPSFMSWNWPLIRKCTFFVFMSSLLAMCAVVVAMIVTLPKTCNPKTAWYHGGVFYEIFPASFQDSDNDGVGDLHGLESRVDYLASLGITAVRLNSIFPTLHYPDDFDNITSLTQVASVLGNAADVKQLTQSLHKRNISLILDLPINSDIVELKQAVTVKENVFVNTNFSSSNLVKAIEDDIVGEAIRKWMELGVDGFYIKGLENFAENANLVSSLGSWKNLLGPHRVLIVSELLLDGLEKEKKAAVLSHIDLVDVYLNVLNGTQHIEERTRNILAGELAPTNVDVWIHWTIGGVDRPRITHPLGKANITLAATIMQLMLPGTPSIFYGDEVALEEASDLHNEHDELKQLQHLATMQWFNSTRQFTGRETLPWLPQRTSATVENFEIISKMIQLRDRSPSIYKNAICKTEVSLPNTQVRRSNDDILLIERVYPRRNSFVSVSNFGLKRVKMDLTSMYYSGHVMLQQTHGEKIYFREFEIGPMETIVVRLDK